MFRKPGYTSVQTHFNSNIMPPLRRIGIGEQEFIVNCKDNIQ